MGPERIHPARRFGGRPTIPGDKSISHRGLIFGALAHGTTEVLDILDSGDVRSTEACLKALGVEITQAGRSTRIVGRGPEAFRAPAVTLDCGNSGTTMRLLMGVLAGLPFSSRMTGDVSLVKRPMRRVADPLTAMGARFELTRDNYAPLTVHGAELRGIDYELKVASAQIKTAAMLAALSARGRTRITGEIASRDHTERLLAHFGARVEVSSEAVEVEGPQRLAAARLQVPGDPSTAAFWMAAASLVDGAELALEDISLNPTRIGFLSTLQRMGAEITIEVTIRGPEPVGRILVRRGDLRGVHVLAAEIPAMIDEIPLLAVVATQATGTTIVEGAEELRVKESDRLEAVATNLRAMGAEIELRHDGFRIDGPQRLKGADIQTFHDHRIAMAFSIAGLVAEGETRVHDPECAAISYPTFFETLRELTRGP